MKDIIPILNRIDRANYLPDQDDRDSLNEIYNGLNRAKQDYILENSEILKLHFKNILNEIIMREPGIMQKDQEISIILEDIKAVLLETLAGYWPEFLNDSVFKAHFDQLPVWIKNKYIKPVTIRKEKPYKSLTRAKAFCILLLREEKIIPAYQTKKQLEIIVKGYWPDGSGRTIYDDYFRYGFSLKEKDNYEQDYKYGLKLFNEIRLK